MRFAIATHAAYPDGVRDDIELAVALRERGAKVRFAVWDDPGAEWRAEDIVLPRSVWDYHLKPAQWFAWLDRVAARSQMINAPSLVRWNSDKRYLLALGDAGIPIIPTAVVPNAEELVSLCKEHSWPDIVVKPSIGASSFGAKRFRGAAIRQDGPAHAARLGRDRTVLVQPFIADLLRERERSLVYFGDELSHSFLKPAFHAGVDASALAAYEPTTTEMALAARVLSALPEAPAVARIDMIRSEQGLVLMEVELIEPELALHLGAGSAGRLADQLIGCANLAPGR